MGPARIGEKQLGSQVGGRLSQGVGDQFEDRRFGPRHFQRPLEAGLELVALRETQLDGNVPGLLAFNSQRLPGEQRGDPNPERTTKDQTENEIDSSLTVAAA